MPSSISGFPRFPTHTEWPIFSLLLFPSRVSSLGFLPNASPRSLTTFQIFHALFSVSLPLTWPSEPLVIRSFLGWEYTKTHGRASWARSRYGCFYCRHKESRHHFPARGGDSSCAKVPGEPSGRHVHPKVHPRITSCSSLPPDLSIPAFSRSAVRSEWTATGAGFGRSL
ncbi:hypothetical protein HOY80DRAFT_738684 [Tuber brumale]|nr:hypothetical protein HOY80DRAFT_738684 [Tuber brumale]